MFIDHTSAFVGFCRQQVFKSQHSGEDVASLIRIFRFRRREVLAASVGLGSRSLNGLSYALSTLRAPLWVCPHRPSPLSLTTWCHVLRCAARAWCSMARGSCDFSLRLLRPLGKNSLIPEEVMTTWVPREIHIGQCELFMKLVALCNFSDVSRNSRLIGFVFSSSALCGIIFRVQ